MIKYLKLFRVKHYIKNILIFLPLLFSHQFKNINLILSVFIAFISFSLLCSAIYIFNDIKDKDLDSKHPKKKFRPIASGEVSVKKAYIFHFLLYFLSNMIILLNNNNNLYQLIILNIYYFINIIYSIKLKNIPIIDITCIMVGFLLRVILGCLVVNVLISSWLYLTIISFSYYLALSKRRNEMLKIGKTTRSVLIAYNKNFLDKMMYVFLTSTIVFYSLWCANISSVLINLYLISIPILLLIIMQYSLIIENNSYGNPVDVIFENKLLLLTIILYSLYMFLILIFT
jgi:prenyltransferase, ubiA family